MATTYLTKTPSASNRKTFTISVWLKRNATGSQQAIFSTGNGNSGPLNFFGFGSSDNLNYWEYQDGYTEISDIKTNRIFTDTGAWYHLVLAVDTTQATASNRTKIYVNGELQTDLGTTGSNQYPASQNQDMAFNQADQHAIGRYEYNNSGLFDGCMSHFHFIDGTAYAASTFGSTDSTTGEWKINTSPSVTYGTNGFFLFKDSNSVTDQSPNSNNYTVSGGTLLDTKDNPSNNFPTLNRMLSQTPPTSNGCLTITKTNSGDKPGLSTFGAFSGKYYFEVKYLTATNYSGIGVLNAFKTKNIGTGTLNTYYGSNDDSVGYWGGVPTIYYGGSDVGGGNYGSAASQNDIVGCAVDLDNGYIYWSVNGSYLNSGSPTSGSSGTGGYALSNIANNNGDNYYVMGASVSGTAGTRTVAVNYGQGFFGTTAVASAGTNASGHGVFEYDVPTGYTALCTKGLNE